MWSAPRLARNRRTPPGFIAPCIPTLAKVAPSGPQWLHEIKHDGYRIIARKDRERVRLWSRHGLSWTASFPLIVDALKALAAEMIVLDGGAVLECENARHDFHGLKTAAARNACLFAFDLLMIDGEDLRPTRWTSAAPSSPIFSARPCRGCGSAKPLRATAR